MKNKYTICFMLGLLLSLSRFSYAQIENSFAIVSYQNALPVGSFTKYIDAYSYNGANIELGQFVTDNLSLGASFSWQKYYQKIPRQTYELPSGDGSVTATQYHWLRQIPIKLNAHYFIGSPQKLLRPYAGLAAGAISIVQETTVADYVIRTSRWNYIVTPELGLQFKTFEESSWGAILGVKYDFTGYNENNIGNLQALLFHVGFMFEIE